MTRSIALLLAVAAIFSPPLALAEEGETVVTGHVDGFREGIRPLLSVDYGWATPSHDDVDFDFSTMGLLEFKLGYTDQSRVQGNVVSMLESYIFASWANDGLGSYGDDDTVDSDFNRFGGGNRVAYGYQGKKMGLDLYNQNSLNWAEFTASDYDAAPPEAQAIFDRYGSTYRFGHLMEGGMKFRVTRSLALTAGAEGHIIYPRYVFWPWLGSVAIYSAVQSAVEYYADDIIEASPGIGPILYFLLKSGVSLGYYFASQSDMNWPFGRETPVTMGTFKVGTSIAF